MNVVLIQISSYHYIVEDVLNLETPLTPHLSIGYLKAYCSEMLDDVNIKIIEPHELKELNNDEITKKIISYNPDVVGFSCYLCNIQATKEIATNLKAIDPSLLIIIGGPEVYNTDHFSDCSSFDIAALGMGEKRLNNILKSKLNNEDISNLSGIIHRKNGEIIINEPVIEIEDINEIPSPFLENVFDLKQYKHVYFETFRRCAFQCGYCFFHKQYKKLTYFKIDRLKQEFQILLDNNIKHVIILDSIFNMPKWGETVCDAICEVNCGKKIDLSADIQAEFVNEQFCRSAKDANFIEFQTGLQTSNQVALKNINRKMNVPRYIQGIQILKDYDFRVNFDIIVGLPDDKPDDIWRSIEFVQNLKVKKSDIRVILLRVIPGTDFWYNHKKYGIEFDVDDSYYITSTQTISKEFLSEFYADWPNRVRIF
jgi:radical SAM superfamily enzyme YgiQ (UPF0313 family)